MYFYYIYYFTTFAAMNEKIQQQRQVIHVHVLSTDEHFYFGSIQAIYDTFSKEDIGIAAQTLYNRGLNEMYVNEKVIIRKGSLLQKKQVRK